jgi:acyl dehydratase
MNYLETFQKGMAFDLGATTVTEEEIVAFGRQFDPQVFHVDPDAAKATPFGGVIASGWHTCGIFMRLLVDSVLAQTAGLGGLGMDAMQWTVPVRPNDTLSARATVVEARPSRSIADAGILGLRCELTNQRDELVWHTTAWSLVRRTTSTR